MGALSGLRVLECTHVLNGPFCGRLLAELGAEVIKIEPPAGELSRKFPVKKNGESLYFMFYNANKKCITLNLKSEKGKNMLLDLIGKADIFIENYRPGVLDRLGVGYETQRKVNPRIIYLSSTGFGQTGPYKDLPAQDIMIQAMCGLVSVNGPPDAPVRIGVAITDFFTGIYSAVAILAALHYRDRTGHGQKIDMAMFDVGFTLLSEHLAFNIAGLPLRTGNSNPITAPYNIYHAKDGYVVIIANDDAQWTRLLKVIGREDLLRERRFETVADRALNGREIDSIIDEWIKNKTVDNVLQVLKAAELPVGPVKSLPDVLKDPQLKEREMIVTVDHPRVGKIEIPGSAFKLSETPGQVTSAGNPVGFDNERVYSDLLSITKQDLEELKSEHVI
jgi:CoA:oxalate CoA-transferase